MFRLVLDERKRREIDPTLRLLQECIADAAKDRTSDAYTGERLRDLHGFFRTTTAWYEQIRQWPAATVVKFVRLGGRVGKLLRLGR